jgi:hypothetical protein
MKAKLGQPSSHFSQVNDFREIGMGSYDLYEGVTDTRSFMEQKIALPVAIIGTDLCPMKGRN